MGLRGPVLAATDLTEAADPALRQGHAVASAAGAGFTTCHVLPEAFRVRVLFPQDAGVAPEQAQLEDKARQIVRGRLDAIGAAADATAIEIETGTAHAGILRLAERLGAGLIVVGPGPTAARVVRSASCPVLIARPSPLGGSVLGATDFSDPSLPAIRMAAAEAARRGARLRLIHCLDVDDTSYHAAAGLPGMMPLAPVPEALVQELESAARDRLREALAATGAAGETLLVHRPPAAGIIEAAQSAATALVVVGTRGRTGLSRIALGSVAEEVIARAPCSVLVVPLHPAE